MQAQRLENRSSASFLTALIAASLLLLGGAGGYAIRALTASAVSTVRTVVLQPTTTSSDIAPGRDTTTVPHSGPQP